MAQAEKARTRLDQAIDRSLAALYSAPSFCLTGACLDTLRLCLGDRLETAEDDNPNHSAPYGSAGIRLPNTIVTRRTKGYVRRVDLALRTVCRVLPPLTDASLDVTRAIEVMTAVRDDTMYRSEARRFALDFQAANRLRDSHMHHALRDALAVVIDDAGLWVPISPQDDAEAIHWRITDLIEAAVENGDIDMLIGDYALSASHIAAGGMPDDPGSSPQRRKAFWEWWLQEAVPAAWNAAEGSD